MKWLQFNDVDQSRINLMQIVSYTVDSKSERYYIKFVHAGGIAITGSTVNYKTSELWLYYLKREDRDADLETLDAICIHEQ